MAGAVDSEYREIGYFARSHGVHGELLVMSDLDLVALFEVHPVVRYHDNRDDLIPARVKEIRLSESEQKRAFFVKLMYVDNRHTAEQLKGKTIFMEAENLEDLDEARSAVPFDQFEVYDEEQNAVGKVVNGFDTAAQQIIEVETEDGSVIMVPLVDEFVVEVDEDEQRLVCRNLEMLKDL